MWVGWQNSGAFGFALIFLLHFLHQGKKWKTNFVVNVKNIQVADVEMGPA